MSDAASGGRSPRIDLLRGVAILLVLLLHFSLSYRLVSSPLAVVVPQDWLRALINNGNFGVTMFFVISGYLITGNSLRRYGGLGGTGLRSFYALRAARILPPLLLVLAIIVPLGCMGVPSFSSSVGGHPLPASFFGVAVLSVLTFWHNVLMQSAGWFNYCLNIYWSLSVEEVFYLAFPLLCVALRRDLHIVLLCLVLIAVAPFYREAHADDELYFMGGYLACFDALALGCLAALLRARAPASARLRLVLTLLGALLLPLSYLSGVDRHEALSHLSGFNHHEALGFSAVALATALLLYSDSAGTSRVARSWTWSLQPLRWLGRHSYELYLFHIILLAGLRNLVPPRHMPEVWKLPWLLAFLAASVLLAHAVARYFADPVNRLLRRHAGVLDAGRPAAGMAQAVAASAPESG